MHRSFLVLSLIATALRAQDYAPPPRLSEAGFFADLQTMAPAPGVVPYEVNSPLWSDGALKTRFIALPPGGHIGFSAEGAWTFPAGTVLIKNFLLEFERGQPSSQGLVETRLLVKAATHEGWDGYSYQWNDQGTEAQLLEGDATLSFWIADASLRDEGFLQDYFFPSRRDCITCHTKGAAYVLGVRTDQLNREHTHHGRVQNQLQTLSELGLFKGDLPRTFETLPRLPDPLDESQPLAARARSYLDANCAQCHRPASVGRTVLDLRFSTPLELTNAVDAFPTLGDLGAADPRIVFPGQPENSTLYLRLLTLGSFRMPTLATSVVDWEGAGVIRRWIEGLDRSTPVAEEREEPPAFALHQNAPNPFNAATLIPYRLAAPGPVELEIFDAVGRRVRTLVRGSLPAGVHSAAWDGRDEVGHPAASGVYFYRLRAGTSAQSRSLVLLR